MIKGKHIPFGPIKTRNIFFPIWIQDNNCRLWPYWTICWFCWPMHSAKRITQPSASLTEWQTPCPVPKRTFSKSTNLIDLLHDWECPNGLWLVKWQPVLNCKDRERLCKCTNHGSRMWLYKLCGLWPLNT